MCAPPSPSSNYNYALRSPDNETSSPATSDVLKDKKKKGGIWRKIPYS